MRDLYQSGDEETAMLLARGDLGAFVERTGDWERSRDHGRHMIEAERAGMYEGTQPDDIFDDPKMYVD
ncbi:hypothetical protein KY362_07435 [Candidatus Woesearchaeota archaeon]|nr:hypothetical protein [Candidatus Woesearchaeota archaeon]